MTTSNNIIKLLESRQWDKIIQDISQVAQTLEIDFFIIGAAARDIGMNGDTRFRVTKDIDFAISITDKAKFYELKKMLCNQFGYQEDSEYKLLHPIHGELDLVPFGEIRINYNQVAAIALNEEGLQEVAEAGLRTIEIAQGHSIKVASLAAVTLLKLISWDDQKDNRGKDAEDINAIIEAYFNLHSDEIFDNHNDLFTEKDDNYELSIIGAQVLGRHIGNILKEKTRLTQQIQRILSEQTSSENRLAKRMMKIEKDNIELKQRYLTLLKNGIEERL
jgi:predicted nucleotidyltransferase